MNADIAPGGAGKETLKVYIFDFLFTFAGWPQMKNVFVAGCTSVPNGFFFFPDQNEEARSRCFNTSARAEDAALITHHC